MNRFRIIFIILASSISAKYFFGCTGSISEINVRDFGAIPGDGKDDTPAIISAIKACKGNTNSKLLFDFGTYDIYGSQKDGRGNFKPAIDIENVTDLTIDGNGSELIGHNYSTMFHFTGCRNISIINLTVDWDPLPYTQGKVILVDSNYIDLEVLPPFIARAGLRTEAILGYDLEKHRMARRFTDHYQKGFGKTTEVIRPGVMRLFIGRQDRFAGSMPSGGYIYNCKTPGLWLSVF